MFLDQLLAERRPRLTALELAGSAPCARASILGKWGTGYQGFTVRVPRSIRIMGAAEEEIETAIGIDVVAMPPQNNSRATVVERMGNPRLA